MTWLTSAAKSRRAVFDLYLHNQLNAWVRQREIPQGLGQRPYVLLYQFQK